MQGQMSLFDAIDDNQLGEKYDAYIVTQSKSFISAGNRMKVEKGEIYTLVFRLNSINMILIEEKYRFMVSEKIFAKCFRYLGYKIVPKHKELWNGKKWIQNQII